MNQNFFIVTGMPRSGTTLLSRILDASTEAIAPPDPYFGFFREYRNAIYEENSIAYQHDEPLSDYFNRELDFIKKNAIMNSNLNIPIAADQTAKIMATIKSFADGNAPLIMDHLNFSDFSNFKELFTELCTTLKNAYGNQQTSHIGFKTAWVEEFALPLIKTFPDFKVIQIVRDPRAMIASREKSSKHLRHSYPVPFLLKHWRKSAAYGIYLKKMHPQNVLLCRYEDLVSDPETETRKICSFLNIKYDSNMINTANHRDGSGNRWNGNSSFGTLKGISSSSAERWKSSLDHDEIRYVEDLCDTELSVLGYSRVTENAIWESVLRDFDSDDNNTDWIEKYGHERLDIPAELLRYYVSKDHNRQNYNKEIIELLFCFECVLDA